MRWLQSPWFYSTFAVVAFLALTFWLQSAGQLGFVSLWLAQAPQPIVHVFESVSRPVGSWFATLANLNQIVVENGKLANEAAGLRLQLVNQESVKSENLLLRKELGLAQREDARQVACSVIARNPDGVSDTIAIDCGTDRGVVVGQPALSEGYLAGRVIFASDRTSTVLLLTAPNSFSGARVLDQPAAIGVVRGSFGSGLTLERVSAEYGLLAGSVVVTTGLETHIRKNIPLGTIDSVTKVPGAVEQTGTIRSPLKFRELDFVSVLLD